MIEQAPVAPKLINAGPSERGWHRLESFNRCPQLYAYEKLAGLEWTSMSPPLVKGILVHVGLAHYYQQRQAAQLGENPDEWYDADEAMGLVAADLGPMGAEWLPLAMRAVAGYKAFYAQERHKVLEVEKELRADVWIPQLSHTVLYTQRADLITEKDGKVWIWDHKTGFRTGQQMTTRYILSGQFQGLRWFGQKLYGDKFGGLILNQVGLGNKEIVYKRPSIPPAPNLLKQFPQVIADTETAMVTLEREARDPWEYPKAASEQVCITPYGRCPGFALCQWGKAGLEEAGAKEKEK